MKKLLSVILVLLTVLSVSACGTQDVTVKYETQGGVGNTDSDELPENVSLKAIPDTVAGVWKCDGIGEIKIYRISADRKKAYTSLTLGETTSDIVLTLDGGKITFFSEYVGVSGSVEIDTENENLTLFLEEWEYDKELENKKMVFDESPKATNVPLSGLYGDWYCGSLTGVDFCIFVSGYGEGYLRFGFNQRDRIPGYFDVFAVEKDGVLIFQEFENNPYQLKGSVSFDGDGMLITVTKGIDSGAYDIPKGVYYFTHYESSEPKAADTDFSIDDYNGYWYTVGGFYYNMELYAAKGGTVGWVGINKEGVYEREEIVIGEKNGNKYTVLDKKGNEKGYLELCVMNRFDNMSYSARCILLTYDAGGHTFRCLFVPDGKG